MQEKIQNIHQKFNAPQNEIRLAIMNFIVDNHRPFSLKEDGYTALKGITLSSAEDFSGTHSFPSPYARKNSRYCREFMTFLFHSNYSEPHLDSACAASRCCFSPYEIPEK